MNKKERLALIKDFVSKYQIDTQEAIVEHLKAAGVVATQATVSRDIKEIGIIKVPVGDTYVYGLPKNSGGLRKLTEKHIKNVTVLGNMINVDLVPGSSAVVKRQLTERFTDEIFSIIADDDSILIIITAPVKIPQITEVIKAW